MGQVVSSIGVLLTVASMSLVAAPQPSQPESKAELEQQLRALDSAIAEGRKLTTDALDTPWFLASWFSDNLALASPIGPGFGEGEAELTTFLQSLQERDESAPIRVRQR